MLGAPLLLRHLVYLLLVEYVPYIQKKAKKREYTNILHELFKVLNYNDAFKSLPALKLTAFLAGIVIGFPF